MKTIPAKPSRPSTLLIKNSDLKNPPNLSHINHIHQLLSTQLCNLPESLKLKVNKIKEDEKNISHPSWQRIFTPKLFFKWTISTQVKVRQLTNTGELGKPFLMKRSLISNFDMF